MATDKIRIKDIAERAGVSVGTVDRVLHERPNVSKSAREKVEKVLAEMDYQPNVYASALAYNKDYTFYCIIPLHDSEAYWDEIEQGVKAATIPFILLDSYLPDLKPLAFFGQDSFQSGYFAARMMMLIASKEKEIMMMKQLKDGHVGSKQQSNRETGFRHYMRDHFPEIKITDVNLPLGESKAHFDKILEEFFSTHPHIHHCITFNSKAHLVGEFLLRTNRRNVQIMGYDMVPKNAECVRQGSISFLIAQHAYMQGYQCIETLFQAIVLKKEVTPVNYMPIELLTKENIEFYRRDNV